MRSISTPTFRSGRLLLWLLAAWTAGTAPALHAQQVTGRVLDDADDSPVSVAEVRALGTGTWTTTSASGAFVLTLHPGTHSVEARALGYRTTTVEVTVGAGSARAAGDPSGTAPAGGGGNHGVRAASGSDAAGRNGGQTGRRSQSQGLGRAAQGARRGRGGAAGAAGPRPGRARPEGNRDRHLHGRRPDVPRRSGPDGLSAHARGPERGSFHRSGQGPVRAHLGRGQPERDSRRDPGGFPQLRRRRGGVSPGGSTRTSGRPRRPARSTERTAASRTSCTEPSERATTILREAGPI